MAKQRVSMRDVARAANVSVSAVSLVARGRPGVAEGTRERVLRVMDVFYGDIVRGIQAEAQRLGYQVLLHMFDREAESMESLRASLAGEVRGLLIANDGDITPELVVRLESVGVPLVLVESYIPGRRLPCILGDNFGAGYAAMRHLLDLGHRSIGVLRGPRKYSSLTDRLRGALAAAAEEGLLIAPELMPQPAAGHPQKGYLQMREIIGLASRPSAVLAVSDKTAFGAMEAIKEAGLRIPGDIAIVSIDDVRESAYARPPLTTVRIPRLEMGTLAMRKLHHQIASGGETPVKSVVYAELVVRESCGAAL